MTDSTPDHGKLRRADLSDPQNSNRFLLAVFLLCIGVCMIPHLMLWNHTHVQIHDHLDADAVTAKVLAGGHYLFAPNQTIVSPLMGGIKRLYLGSEFDPYKLLFTFLPPLLAIITNELLMRTAAFFGMALLLADHVLAEHRDRYIVAALAAVAFATLQFWPPGGLAVAGIPLLTWAYFNTRNDGFGIREILAILAFGIYSNPAYVAPFVLLVMVAFSAVDLLQNRTAKIGQTAAFAGMLIAVYVVANWRLVVSFVGSAAATSQRVEMISPWLDTAGVSFFTLFLRQFLLPWHSRFIIDPLVVLVLLALIVPSPLKPTGAARQSSVTLGTSLLVWFSAATALCAIDALWFTDTIQKSWHALHLPFFDWSRFDNLVPTGWFVSFAISLALLLTLANNWRRAALTVTVAVGAVQMLYNVSSLTQYADWRNEVPGFTEFFSPSLFALLRKNMDPRTASYRVGSVGIHPSIALYNGFQTVDGLLPYYPLAYKHQFRKVIAGELAKDPNWARYYDHSGARVYLFNKDLAQCDFLCTKKVAPAEINFNMDVNAFYALGGRYLLSVSKIRNASSLGLQFVGTYTTADSPWRLTLYRVVRGP